MIVPFLDLQAHHDPIRAEVMAAIGEVVDQHAFAGGPFVDAFEKEFAAFCGTDFAIGVGSGTEALWLALWALGIGPGDEVITVPSTFIATAEAISVTGARPVFVDIDSVTYNLDPTLLEAAITPRTKAIVPVHLFGQPAPMDPILAIASEHNLPVIEDSAQAHGALYKDRPVGSLGLAGCFSFYPGKNLGAWGEAGAVVTRDPVLAQQIRVLRDHGQSQPRFRHERVGWNCRMDGMQAAVLSTKLPRLEQANRARRRCAQAYHHALADVAGVVLPVESGPVRHVYHVYAIRTPDRDALRAHLLERGIECRVHYPIPLHLQTAYADLDYGVGAFPVAEAAAGEFLSLPMFPELTAEQINHVVEAVKSFAQSTVCINP